MLKVGYLFILVLFLAGLSAAQTKTNLEIFYSLSDSSVNLFIATDKPHGSVKAVLNNGEVYSIFNNHILGYLKSNGVELFSGKGDSTSVFSFTIEKAGTNYKDLFRDGFLGDYLAIRELTLKGNYFYTVSGLKEFNYVYTDTVRMEQIKELENTSFKFTTGIIPTEPFFSGLFEPIVALGTAAAAVILFFTVRSR